MVERDWLLRRREGLKRVRSLKLQLFCTFAGLVPSVPASATGERRSFTDDVCLFLMLWPRGLASLTRSLKLNFWLKSEMRMVEDGVREGQRGNGVEVVRRWNNRQGDNSDINEESFQSNISHKAVGVLADVAVIQKYIYSWKNESLQGKMEKNMHAMQHYSRCFT